METGTLFNRESSKSSFTDDGMSDLENEYRDNNRLSLTSSLPTSPSASSYNKMSVDSDDARSISSTSRRDTNTMETTTIMPMTLTSASSSSSASSALASASSLTTASSASSSASASASSTTVITSTIRAIKPIGSSWVNSSSNNHIRQQDELFLVDCNNATVKKYVQTKSSYDLGERRDPERRNVNRRSSLLPKSKALLRVIDQADEDTHLGDLEMRREHETTVQLKTFDNGFVVEQEGVPAASWTKVTDFPLYQCSKLNPEVEMTSFQLENMASLSPQQQQTYKSIKRKASEDRFEPYPTSIGLKRRAVSPSVSLNGSPILTAYSSPPTSFSSYYGPGGPGAGPGAGMSPNAAARLQHKPSHHSNNSSFNLHDASGGLSRMSLSE